LLNHGFEYREQVGAAAAGRSVLDHLSSRHRHSPESEWRLRLEAGEITRAGVRARAEDTLRAGDWLAWQRPPWEEPDVPLAWALLFRDTHLLAVAKPRGLPAVPAGGFLEHTLLRCVRRAFPEAAPMHRLGRGTSGVMLFTRTAEARRALSDAWRRGGVEKAYRALITGVPVRESFSVEVPIGPVRHRRLGFVHAATPQGRKATSHVRVLEGRGDRALVEVRIPTGRPHQIRIHLAAAGHPLVGDPLYVAGGHPGDALPGDGGYWLHALRLVFGHPVAGRQLAIECGAPMLLRASP
jgi:23S rRNA pseudouridine1911/1915/1917 synthase